VSLLLLLGVVLIPTRFSIDPAAAANPSFLEACDWVKKNTSKEDLFITEPFTSESGPLRLMCHRGLFGTRKDGGQVVFNRAFALEWDRRYHGAIKAMGRDPASITDIAREYKVEYVFSDSPLNLPKKVFRFGQKEFGGHYRISHEMLKKIKVVGMIPSYKSLPARVRSPIRRKYAKPGEKLIFLYASVGGLIKPEVFGTLMEAVETLRGQGRRIRIVHAGDYGLPRRVKRRYPWLTYAGPVTTDEFYAILASSDLVFQHQGLGTLAQAISAGVPAIANVKDVRDERSPWHAHAWEVEPFARAGACMFFSFSDPIKKIITAIESLLYDEKKGQRMRQDQKAIYSAGELVVFEDIKRLLNCASR